MPVGSVDGDNSHNGSRQSNRIKAMTRSRAGSKSAPSELEAPSEDGRLPNIILASPVLQALKEALKSCSRRKTRASKTYKTKLTGRLTTMNAGHFQPISESTKRTLQSPQSLVICSPNGNKKKSPYPWALWALGHLLRTWFLCFPNSR